MLLLHLSDATTCGMGGASEGANIQEQQISAQDGGSSRDVNNAVDQIIFTVEIYMI